MTIKKKSGILKHLKSIVKIFFYIFNCLKHILRSFKVPFQCWYIQGGQKTWKTMEKTLEFDNLGKKKLEKPVIWEILKKNLEF